LHDQLAKLAEADRVKEDFLAKLAHELHSPVALALGQPYKLPATAGDKPNAEQTRQLLEWKIRHMTQLVDDLLDMVHLSRSTQQVPKERLDLAELVRQATEERRDHLQQAGLILALDLPKTPVWMNGDPKRLRQALHILLDPGPRHPAGY